MLNNLFRKSIFVEYSNCTVSINNIQRSYSSFSMLIIPNRTPYPFFSLKVVLVHKLCESADILYNNNNNNNAFYVVVCLKKLYTFFSCYHTEK